MAIPVQTPTIERHPLRDAYMVNAPEEVNPMRVPFIGTRKECEKVLTHMKKQLVKEGYELSDTGFCKLARAYAKEHNIIALDFRKEKIPVLCLRLRLKRLKTSKVNRFIRLADYTMYSVQNVFMTNVAVHHSETGWK